MTEPVKMSTVKEKEEDSNTISSKIQHVMPLYVFGSFLSLFISAIFFITAIATTNWYTGKDDIKIGVWKYCVKADPVWLCYPCAKEFCVAVQCFTILGLFGYACAIVLLILNLLCRSKRSTRMLAIGLCLLAFCIVSLQIMTIIVYGVKVKEYLHDIEADYFTRRGHISQLSWSFVFAIFSVFITTIAGVFNFIEIKNIVVENFADV